MRNVTEYEPWARWTHAGLALATLGIVALSVFGYPDSALREGFADDIHTMFNPPGDDAAPTEVLRWLTTSFGVVATGIVIYSSFFTNLRTAVRGATRDV